MLLLIQHQLEKVKLLQLKEEMQQLMFISKKETSILMISLPTISFLVMLWKRSSSLTMKLKLKKDNLEFLTIWILNLL